MFKEKTIKMIELQETLDKEHVEIGCCPKCRTGCQLIQETVRGLESIEDYERVDTIECLAKTCDYTLSLPTKRRKHLINIHNFNSERKTK